MAEWLKAHAWKACLGETLTWVRIPLSPPYFQLLSACRNQFAITLRLSAISATFEPASAISFVTTSPYTFIVVRMSECLISFCCTATVVPTASNHER